MYDDDFKITMQFQEDEVRMDKKQLTKKGKAATNANNVSTLSENRSAISGMNQAFVDKSQVDTSNVILEDGNILAGLNLTKSHTNNQ